jgi:hypothetical protein
MIVPDSKASIKCCRPCKPKRREESMRRKYPIKERRN